MDNSIQIIIFVLIGLSSISSLLYLILEFQEISLLKSTLKNITGKTKIDSKEDLIKIKKFLSSTIKYDVLKKHKKRPLFRHAASHILKSKYGFCGENARVAIKLFILGKIKARRIYLFRKEWQHVLIEHQFNDKWYMFDGHYDPKTVLEDNKVATILSENINEFPNQYPDNPYLDFCRLKLFQKINFLKPLSKIKLPMFFAYVAESPYLIKAILLFTISILLIVSSLIFLHP